MNPSERIAQHVFKTVHKGTDVRFRSQQSTGEAVYDFDVTYPDGTKAALEVTLSTDQESINTLAHLRAQRSVVDAVTCQHSWVVNPHPDCRIDLIRKDVDRYLSVIEAEGVTEFTAEPGRMTPSVSRIFQDLRIVEGLRVPASPPARIWIGGPTSSVEGSIVNPDDLQQAIEYEANKDDNRRKLKASHCKERHLFVCIDPLNTEAWQALITGGTPILPPMLPVEVTHVWAATDEHQDGILVWVAEPPKHWQNLGIVPKPPQP
ncbi:MAG: hypothetical protein ABSH47_22760 [Bryobacteraceae bacterium]|jgi:hypothetical protein